MRKAIAGIALALVALVAGAQTPQTIVNLKPLKGVWRPADIASVEVRVRGRLTTDAASTHRIIGRVTLSKFDWVSALTMRTTLLVPATQTWEVKSLSLLVNTAEATGLASVEVISRTLAVPHVAPAGKTLAIDVDPSTGVLVLGPVDMTPTPAPAPDPVVTPVPPPAPTGAVISALRVVRVDTAGTVLFALVDGMTIDLAALPTRNVSVEALASSPAGIAKVEFQIDGVLVSTELNPPYALCGDWNQCPQFTAPGQHALVATPFDGASAAGTPATIRYTVK